MILANVWWWEVKDKPILGYGFDGFRKNYMNYQAAYLHEKQLPETINNPASNITIKAFIWNVESG